MSTEAKQEFENWWEKDGKLFSTRDAKTLAAVAWYSAVIHAASKLLRPTNEDAP